MVTVTMTTRRPCLGLTSLCGTTLFRVTEAPRCVQLEVSHSRETNIEQADSVFSGISTFGRLPYQPCLGQKNVKYDIAFIGEQILRQRVRTMANMAKVPPSTPVLRTVPVLASDPLVFARARAV